jgi:hypothetical protein
MARVVRALRASRRPLALLAGCLVLSAAMAPAPAGALTIRAFTTGPRPSAGQPDPARASLPQQHLILIGVTGLRWSDVRPGPTPNLWRLASTSSLANLSGRTVQPYTCAPDGWLTIGAGVRARMPGSTGDSPQCVSTPAGLVASSPSTAPGGVTSATVPEANAVDHYNAPFDYSAHLGVLGDLLAARGGCATAVGPGAALALARSDGSLARYVTSPVDATAAVLEACPLTVVDAGGLPADADNGPATAEEAAARQAAARTLDQRIGRLLAGAPQGSGVIVAGVGDGDTSPRLAALMAHGLDAAAGPTERGWLRTRSTRQVGLAQLTDLTPTVLRAVTGGPGPATLTGSVITGTPPRSGTTANMVDELVAMDRADSVVTRMIGGFFAALGVVGALLLTVALLLTSRARRGQQGLVIAGDAAAAPRGGRRLTDACALSVAAVPVATFLANLAPWARWSHPALLLAGLSVAIAAVIAAVAMLGPWRRACLGPAGVVSGVTVAVLTLDVVTGSHLQLNALFGLSPTVAGRFYGFGNTAWAIYAVAALVLAGAIAQPLVTAGRRRLAVLAVVAVGAVTVVSDGWPGLGSDFGGMLALAPSFALLALLVAGVRLSLGRLATVGVGALAVVFGVAVLDWLRPPAQRTHLGAFVQQVFDGDATATLGRKIGANLHSLSAPLAFTVPLAFVLVAFAVWSPGRLRATAISTSYQRLPNWRSTLIASYAVAVLGFAANDSGISIPAVCLLIGVPLAVAVTVAASEVAPTPVAAPEPSTTPRR